MSYFGDCVKLGVAVFGLVFLIFITVAFVCESVKSIRKWRRDYTHQKALLWLTEATAGLTFAILMMMAVIVMLGIVGFVVKLLM